MPTEVFLVEPQGLQRTVLHGCHDLKSSGHLRQQKTLERLKQNYMWYNMSWDCINYVTSCCTCNQNKKPNVRPKASLVSFMPVLPWNVFNDQFTKWIEMAALPDQCDLSVAQKFFGITFGCPMEVHTDQGKTF